MSLRILSSFLVIGLMTTATTLAWAEEPVKVVNEKNLEQRTEGSDTEARALTPTDCKECHKNAWSGAIKDNTNPKSDVGGSTPAGTTGPSNR